MNSDQDVIIVDAGNTSIKIAQFKNGVLIEVQRFNSEIIQEANEFLKQNKSKDIAVCSVLNNEDTNHLIADLNNILLINHETPTPLTSDYSTPSTLGMDRKCNALGVYSLLQNKHGVAIDVGTCIKFDMVSNTGLYKGGSISPGFSLRYKSLNDYTGKLPLLSNKQAKSIVGISTEESITAGVVLGMEDEINGFISRYESEFDDLAFFVTGGDAKYFDIHSKNNIFAIENLTLQGIYEIYKHNK